jgi:hypothetical protein
MPITACIFSDMEKSIINLPLSYENGFTFRNPLFVARAEHSYLIPVTGK